MITSPEQTRRPKFSENSLLLVAGLLAHTPLYYQLPRWANGLDPTFVHPRWMAHSSFPLVLHMAAIHPFFLDLRHRSHFHSDMLELRLEFEEMITKLTVNKPGCTDPA